MPRLERGIQLHEVREALPHLPPRHPRRALNCRQASLRKQSLHVCSATPLRIGLASRTRCVRVLARRTTCQPKSKLCVLLGSGKNKDEKISGCGVTVPVYNVCERPTFSAPTMRTESSPSSLSMLPDSFQELSLVFPPPRGALPPAYQPKFSSHSVTFRPANKKPRPSFGSPAF